MKNFGMQERSDSLDLGIRNSENKKFPAEKNCEKNFFNFIDHQEKHEVIRKNRRQT